MTGTALDIIKKVKNNYIYFSGTVSGDTANYSGTNNIYNGSSLPSANPYFDIFLKAMDGVDISITSGGADLSPVIQAMDVPDSIKAKLYFDAEGLPRAPVWAIGAYQTTYIAY